MSFKVKKNKKNPTFQQSEGSGFFSARKTRSWNSEFTFILQ